MWISRIWTTKTDNEEIKLGHWNIFHTKNRDNSSQNKGEVTAKRKQRIMYEILANYAVNDLLNIKDIALPLWQYRRPWKSLGHISRLWRYSHKSSASSNNCYHKRDTAASTLRNVSVTARNVTYSGLLSRSLWWHCFAALQKNVTKNGRLRRLLCCATWKYLNGEKRYVYIN